MVPTASLAVARYADRIEEDAAILSGLYGESTWSLPVPSCPGWRLEDLLRHLGAVHRWATTYISQGLEAMLPAASEKEMLRSGPSRRELGPWLLEGAAALSSGLRRSPADLRCWTFLPAPSPLIFWARRQAHETAIHRVDGELALGSPRPFPGDFAADGIGEFLLGFAVRSRKRLRHDPTTAAVLLAEDTDDRWRFAGTPDGLQVEVGAEVVAPTIVSGPAHHLYLLVWNRNSLDQLTLTGSPDPVEWLLQVLRVTWG